MQELLCNNGATADAIIKTALLQKLLTSLGLSPDDVAKMFGLQKSMYDSGASPQVTKNAHRRRQSMDLHWGTET